MEFPGSGEQKSLFPDHRVGGREGVAQVEDPRVILRREGIGWRYVTEAHEAKAAVNRLAHGKVPLGVDIETARRPEHLTHPQAGLDPYLSRPRLLQIYAGGDTVYLFDLFSLGMEVFKPLWRLPMVAHNAVFDLKHLIHAGVDPLKMGCTMLMGNALSGRLSSLAAMVKQHIGWQISKSAQTSDWGSQQLAPSQLAYAALDAVLVYQLQRKLRPLLIKQKRVSCYRLMRDVQRAVAGMELNGIHFDFKSHGQLVSQWRLRRDESRKALATLLGPGVSPGSARQVSQWLTAHLDSGALNHWPRTKTGQLKTDAATLSQHSGHPMVASFLNYKEVTQLLSTFGSSYTTHKHPCTGRLHGHFRIGGTATGRLSCHSPNVQNPPRISAFRALFSAPPGRVMVVADYGQIELRIAALLSGDPQMLTAYAKGLDLHVKTAAAVAGVPVQEVTGEQRQAAKAVNFGLLYGQGYRGLAAYARATYGVDMTEEQARGAQEAFFKTYPVLRNWQQETAQRARRYQRVATPLGRVRDFDRESGGYRYTEALNTPIQGGAAEVLMAALIRLDDSLKETDAKLVNIVHDEIVLEAAAKGAEQTASLLTRAMIRGYLDVFPGADTTGLVEAATGTTWAEAK